MVEVRACVYLSVLFLCFHVAIGKPFLGLLWCELVCEEDDPGTTTTASDAMDDLLCGGCFPTRTTTANPLPVTTPIPGNPGNPGNPWNSGQPFNLMIPPANGMNVTIWRPTTDGGSSWVGIFPWSQAAASAAPGGVTAAATAAPAVTTPAAGATTAAAAATTAAPTTAAPAGK